MAMSNAAFNSLLSSTINLQQKYTKFLKDFLMEMGMRAIAQLKKLTPVDTGDLRNHWELQGVFRDGSDLYIVLFNPMEYASFVEDGHMNRSRTAWIEGFHMAKLSIAKIEAELPSRYTLAFNAFLNTL